MAWIRKTWWLAPVVVVVAFDVWAALSQLGVVGDDTARLGSDVDGIAAAVWLSFALAAGAGLLLRDRRPHAAGALMMWGAFPLVMFLWFPPAVLVGLACVASGVSLLARVTRDGVRAA
jgi:hypothetical protein